MRISTATPFPILKHTQLQHIMLKLNGKDNITLCPEFRKYNSGKKLVCSANVAMYGLMR
jgi:hypothetical protein